MRCDEVQAHLAEHLVNQLTERLSNQLSDTVQSSVRAHMLSCSDCCNELDDFAEIKSFLDFIPIEPCDSAAMRARFNASHLPPLLPNRSLPEQMSRWPHTRLQRMVFSAALISLFVAALVAAHLSGKRSVLRSQAAAKPATAAKPELPGTLTGQVRRDDGTAAPGVRVAVMAVPVSGGPPAMELARLEQTDADGRYRLSDIPPGRYYVVAGSMDVPTYFPGTLDISAAAMLSVQAGAVMEGIDFAHFVPALTAHQADEITAEHRVSPLVSPEVHPDEPSPGLPVVSTPELLTISVTFVLDTGERLPYKPDTLIVFTGVSGSIQVRAEPVVGNLFRAVIPAGESYTVTISNIAEGYAVLSIFSGSLDLTADGRFTPAPSASVPSSIIVTFTRKAGF